MTLAYKNGEVRILQNDEEAKNLITLEVTQEEWEAALRLARGIDGKIFLGKTDEEKAEDARIANFDRVNWELSQLDEKQTRSSAEIAEALISGVEPSEETKNLHRQRSERTRQLRAERKLYEK